MGDTWEPTTRPWIVCAAIFFDGLVIAGARHHDMVMNKVIERLGGHKAVYEACKTRPIQGFIDQFGRFYTREEAMLVARENDQIIVTDEQMLSVSALHSEDLY